jgi:hypothetical protein
MRRNSEPDLNGSWRPSDGVSDDQLFDAVIPDNPCRDPHGFAGGGDAGVRELFGRQGPRLSLCSPGYRGHLHQGIERTFDLAVSTSATGAGKGTTRPDQLRDVVEGVRDEAVVGPLAALLAGEDAGIDEHLQVVGDSGLGQADRLDEVANAGLLIIVSGDQGDQPEPGRVGDGFERGGEGVGLSWGHDLADHGGTALAQGVRLVQEGQRGRHGLIVRHALTDVDGLCLDSPIDIRQWVRRSES